MSRKNLARVPDVEIPKEFNVYSGKVLSSHDETNGISTSGTLVRFFKGVSCLFGGGSIVT